MALSTRDLAVLQLLGRFRYLRSTFLEAFLGGNATALRWRLRDLFDAGYVDRPRDQTRFANVLCSPLVYTLAGNGRKVLAGLGCPGIDKRPHPGNFAHDLMICAIAASIELAIKRDHLLGFIPESDIVSRMEQPVGHLHPRAFVLPRDEYVIPDALFGVRTGAGVVLYALEADRGTEPVRRRTGGSSYAAKVDQYDVLIGERHYRAQLKTPAPLVVLHVTKGRARLEQLRALAAGKPHHLFTSMTDGDDFGQLIRPSDSFFFGPWTRSGLPDFYLNA